MKNLQNIFSNLLLKYINPNLIEAKRAKNFNKLQSRFIRLMIKGGKISKFKLKLIELFVTLLGCGKYKNAPGTIASVATVFIWFGLTMIFLKFDIPFLYENIFWAATLLITTIYATATIPIYTSNLPETDHPSIVIDEFIGQIITLSLTYPLVRSFYHDDSWLLTKIVICTHLFLSFLLFRALDISKPLLIGWVDKNIKTPFGVILDDIIAGIFSALISITIFVIYKSSITQLHSF